MKGEYRTTNPTTFNITKKDQGPMLPTSIQPVTKIKSPERSVAHSPELPSPFRGLSQDDEVVGDGGEDLSFGGERERGRDRQRRHAEGLVQVSKTTQSLSYILVSTDGWVDCERLLIVSLLDSVASTMHTLTNRCDVEVIEDLQHAHACWWMRLRQVLGPLGIRSQ
jgi:hypothetical protein